VQRLQERLQEFAQRVERLERDLRELQARFDALEQEANAMREELARRNNTRTHGTQTTLTGPKLDSQAAEVKKMKVMLEELQTKLKELIDKYRKKFGQEAKQIADSLGINELLKEDTVFQRLYDDALDRVERLEKLREKIRKESRRSPRMAAAAEGLPAEDSVLEAVEQSKLKGLKQWSKDAASRPVTSEQECQASPVVDWADRKLRSPPSREWSPAPLRMKTSSSLPLLPQMQQSVSVFELNLGGRRRAARR